MVCLNAHAENDCRRGKVFTLFAAIAVLAVLFSAGVILLHQSNTSYVRSRAQAAGIDLLPVPMRAKIRTDMTVWPDASVLSPSVRTYDEVFRLFGFQVGENGLAVYFTEDPSLEEEAYRLNVSLEGVQITASGRQGVFAAVSTLAQLVHDGRIVASEIKDKPSIPQRGVIEGFYGVPWTHEYRLDLFDFMGRFKLNTYIYAPKSDKKLREEWRSMYTDDELTNLKEMIACASEHNVRFVYAISPGLDIDLGDGYEKDFENLTEKCASLYDVGVRDFAILLDDISTLDAKGHAALVNDFQSEFIKSHEGCTDLIMITPEYCKQICTEYTDEIVDLLDPDILVMWTGNGVVSSSITEKHLKPVNQAFGRKMFIWWNYPVNDFSPNELFFGPCENLDAKLYGSVSGFVSNPMNQGYASMLPLITIADFLWNPAAYDPEESIEGAIRRLSPDCAEGMYCLMDLLRGSMINGGKSSFSFREEIVSYRDGADGASEKLRSKIEKMKKELTLLLGSNAQKLVSELRPWIDKSLDGMNAAIDLTHFNQAIDAETKIEKALSFVQNYQAFSENSAIVSMDVLTPFLRSAKETINAVLGSDKSEGTSVAHTVYTDLPTYQTNEPLYAADGDRDTFFWSSAAPKVDDCFTVDLGEVREVTEVHLAMGSQRNKSDIIHSGVIEYSSDGKQYIILCDTDGRDTDCTETFSGRYVRVRCTEAQSNWVIISSFDVEYTYTLPEGIEYDGSDQTDFAPLFDKNLFTVFSHDPIKDGGHTLTIDASDLNAVELFLLQPEGIHVYTKDNDGAAHEEIMLSHHVLVETEGEQMLCITFDGETPAQISEIIFL